MQGGRKSSMAATPRYRVKTPTDVWSIKERLCLASSVLRSGDQNWVSVSRAIRPFGENNRPADWFNQKNCALQYSDLLEKVETPKRKRGERSDGIDTPGDTIVRKLTLERIEELKKFINDEQQRHKKMRKEIEMVKCGQLDEKLDDIWRGIQDEIRAKEIADTEHQKWLKDREIRLAALKAAPKALFTVGKNKRGRICVNEVRRNSSQSEQSEQESALDSPLSEPLSIEVDDVTSPLPGMLSTEGSLRSPVRMPVASGSTPCGITTTSTSPLLTSLLKSPSPATAPSTAMMSPTAQGKDMLTSTTPPTPPRLTSTPQPFFNPSSALASAAARQLAVATAANMTTSPSASLFSSMKSIEVPRSPNHGAQSGVSATSSAPTLSKLLEMPPSMPGKLPPLPIIHHTEQSPLSASAVASTFSTIATTNTTTACPLVSSEMPITFPISRVSDALATVNAISDVQPQTVSVLTHQMSVPELNEHMSLDIPEVQQLAKLDRKDEYDTFESETSLDMDMEAIVNEIMKEDIVVETSEQLEEQLEKAIDECGMLEQVANETILTSEATQAELIAACIKEGVSTQIKEEEEAPIDVESIVEHERVVAVKTEDSIPQTVDSGDVEPTQEIVDLPTKIDLKTEEVEMPPQIDTADVEVIEVIEGVVDDEFESVVTEQPESEVSIVESPFKEEQDVEESSEDLDKIAPQKLLVKRGRGRPSKASLLQQKLELERREEMEDKMADTTDEERTPGDEKEDSKSVLMEEESKDSTSNIMEDIGETAPPSCQPESADETDQKNMAPSSISDSVPNSPVSTPLSDDQDSLRDYKVWKKAIMLVWRAAANHKYANVFLHPVTNDMAPGYHSIVYRPMDLCMIKKNIETGLIKTTAEFQRDMMLMFQNAIMYNSSDHDVCQMAIEMQKEVMEVIQDFLATQLMVQTTETKVLRGRESRDRKNEGGSRTDSESRDDDIKKKRHSVSETESKSKKRKD